MSVYIIVWLLLSTLSDSSSSSSSTSLPAFAADFSEVAISAMIERSSSQHISEDMHDNSMHLALFLVGRKALVYMPQMPFLAMNASTSRTSRKWRNVAMKWRDDMKRMGKSEDKLPEQQVLDCRFRSLHSLSLGSSPSFTSKGVYVPSNTSEDSGFNRMIEVLRCHINPQLVPSKKDGREKLRVEIINPESGMLIFCFNIPWRTRQIGYGFRHTKVSSLFDPWRRPYNGNFQDRAHSTSLLPSIHLCSPAIRPLEPHRKDPGLPALLEFVEHNILIGVDHQFLGVFLDPQSKVFQQVLQLLGPYIQPGKVSMASMALRGIDDASGFLGAMLIDDYARIIHDQQCLYYSKGIADYVYIAHATEFLTIRKYPLSVGATQNRGVDESSREKKQLPNLLNYIEKNERLRSESQKSCVHIIQSYGVPDPNGKRGGPDNNFFLTDYYKDATPLGPLPAWILLLVPTNRVWLVAWHVVAACGYPISPDTTLRNYLYRDITKPISKKSDKSFDIDILNMDDAISYFYRGHFEPWQMSREKQRNNYHLDIYKESIRERLTRLRNYSSVETMIKLSLDRSLKYSPRKSTQRTLPVGKKALISSGWKECSYPCRNFMELLMQ